MRLRDISKDRHASVKFSEEVIIDLALKWALMKYLGAYVDDNGHICYTGSDNEDHANVFMIQLEQEAKFLIINRLLREPGDSDDRSEANRTECHPSSRRLGDSGDFSRSPETASTYQASQGTNPASAKRTGKTK